MAFQVLLAGQDITNNVDQLTIQIVDALGQASGAGNSALQQGRAGTIQFDTNLGPAYTAIGAGQAILGGPQLVRQGELIIHDALGRTIWGGFATKFTDISTSKLSSSVSTKTFTQINGVDYEGQLARILVNLSFSAQTDIQIIQAALNQYAPWIDTSLLPPVGNYTFPAKVFNHTTLLQVLQTIAGVTGWLIWVDFYKKIHYVSPAATQTAPFGLSDSPDFLLNFPHKVTQFVIDDNSGINRVTFYGGKTPSGDFWQDVSPLANGNNKVFSLAYYPRVTSDGKFHAKVNGVQQVVGYATGDQTPSNTLKSAGGLCDALMNPDASNITFDVAPPSGATVLIEYQYEFPLSIVVTDETSHRFFGNPYLDGFIQDSSVFDTSTGIQRCKVLLAQQSFGLITLKIDIWQPGLIAGQTIVVHNTLRGINNVSFLLQEIDTEPLGAGNFVYHLSLGAWNWNVIDVITKLTQAAAGIDRSTTENTLLLIVVQAMTNANAHVVTAMNNIHSQPYYARASAVGDGHDAYPGFATVST